MAPVTPQMIAARRLVVVDAAAHAVALDLTNAMRCHQEVRDVDAKPLGDLEVVDPELDRRALQSRRPV